MARAYIFDCYKLFQDDPIRFDDKSHPEWPSVNEFKHDNRELTTRDLTGKIGILEGWVKAQ